MRDKLYENFPSLAVDDIRSTSMGASGADILLSPLAQQLIPYYIECKKRAAFAIYKDFEQSKGHLKEGEHSLLVIQGDRKYPLAVITLEHFMELIRNGSIKQHQD